MCNFCDKDMFCRRQKLAKMKKLPLFLKYFPSRTVYICLHYDSLVCFKESPLEGWIIA